MKLLFDHHLSPRLASRLSDIFPDSSHVLPHGLDRADDVVVWIRIGNCRTQQIEDLLRQWQANIESMEADSQTAILVLF